MVMVEVPPAKHEDLNNDDRHGGVFFVLGGIREVAMYTHGLATVPSVILVLLF